MLLISPVFAEGHKFEQDPDAFKCEYGQAHYSWIIVFKKICSQLSANGIPFKVITRPEIYSTDISKRVLLGDFPEHHRVRVLHIRPLELIRLMPDAFNMCYYLWEFPRLSNGWLFESPYYNFTNTLLQMDHVFAANDTFKTFLERFGVKSVSTLPLAANRREQSNTPLSFSKNYNGCHLRGLSGCEPGDTNKIVEVLSSHQQKLEEVIASHKRSGRKILLTIANPWDVRKNILEQIMAFGEQNLRGRKIALIIKSSITAVDPWNQFAHLITVMHKLDKLEFCPDIWMTSETLSDEDIDLLYLSTDAYLCSSSAEGLNLPVIQAAILKKPIISPLHSAMSSYLDSTTCVPVEYERCIAPPQASCLQGQIELPWYKPSREQIAASILEFCGLSPGAIELMAGKCQEIVGTKMSNHSFVQAISDINPE